MVLLPSTTLLRTHSLTLLTISYYLLTSPQTLLSSSPIWILGESMQIRAASFSALLSKAPPKPPPTGQRFQGASLFDAPALAEAAAAAAAAGSVGTTGLGSGSSSKDYPVTEVLALLGLVLIIAALTQMVLTGELGMGGVVGAIEASSAAEKNPVVPKLARLNAGVDGIENGRDARRLGEEVHTLHSAQGRWMALAGVRVVVMGVLIAWIYLFHREMSGQNAHYQSSVMALLANRVVFTGAMMDMLFWGYLYTVIKEEAREVAVLITKWRGQKIDD